MNQFPIYVISKSRFQNCLTAEFLTEEGTPFWLVVEPQEAHEYALRFGEERLKILPFSNLGLGSIPARNWVWQDSINEGYDWHWILDDNIRKIYRLHKGKRLPCRADRACEAVELFTLRYENIGISGMNYTMFVTNDEKKPYRKNVHVYSCLLIRNELDYRWRGRYNEDTDLCLQVLSGGWCTILFNAFNIAKTPTMKMKGGNTDELYASDGRLTMSRSLERAWPGVVETTRKFRRPQHAIKHAWRRFDTPLIRRKDIDWDNLEAPEMKLKAKKEIKTESLKEFYEQEKKGASGTA